MSEAKHTPGPWRARRSGLGFAITAGLPGDMVVVAVAEAEEGDPATAHDAALIAAAPDLLAALREMQEHLATLDQAVSLAVSQAAYDPANKTAARMSIRVQNAADAARKAVRAAIAKAEGQP